jgi:ABC-type Fe3+ transport system permease subunit
VDWLQIICGTLLVLALVSLFIYHGFYQVRALVNLPDKTDLSDEERRYERNKAWRRLINSFLMLILAILLAGALLFLEVPAQHLADQEIAKADSPLPPAVRSFQKLYGWYWLVTLLVLLAVVLLALIDSLAIRSWGLRQRRKLNEDRREMLRHQLARLRHQRNGQG